MSFNFTTLSFSLLYGLWVLVITLFWILWNSFGVSPQQKPLPTSTRDMSATGTPPPSPPLASPAPSPSPPSERAPRWNSARSSEAAPPPEPSGTGGLLDEYGLFELLQSLPVFYDNLRSRYRPCNIHFWIIRSFKLITRVFIFLLNF